MYFCVSVPLCLGALRGQEKTLNFLELELRAVVSQSTCVLGTKSAPARAASKRSLTVELSLSRPLKLFLLFVCFLLVLFLDMSNNFRSNIGHARGSDNTSVRFL